MFRRLYATVPEDDPFRDFVTSVYRAFKRCGRLTPGQFDAIEISYFRSFADED